MFVNKAVVIFYCSANYSIIQIFIILKTKSFKSRYLQNTTIQSDKAFQSAETGYDSVIPLLVSHNLGPLIGLEFRPISIKSNKRLMTPETIVADMFDGLFV